MTDTSALDAAITCEAEWITARHGVIANCHGSMKRPPSDSARAGLALSGGGIRSATFSLGLMQALSRHGCFAGIDYLSTVSGGSYIGSFFGALYVPPEQRFGNALSPAEEKAFIVNPLGSLRGLNAIARLREFGRYLTPGGTSDLIFGTSLIARNWLAVQIVLALVPLFGFLLLRCLDNFSRTELSTALDDSRSMNIGLLALIGWLIATGIAAGYWLSRKEEAIFSRRARLLTPVFGFVTAATAWGWVQWHRQEQPNAPLLILAIPSCAIIFYVLALLLYGEPQLQHFKANDRDRALAAFQAEDKVRARMTRWLASANTVVVMLLVLFVVNLLGEQLMTAVRQTSGSWQNVLDSTHRRNLWAGIMDFIRLFWPMVTVLAPLLLTVWANSALRRGTGPGWLARSSGQTVLGFSILLLWLAVLAAVAAGIRQAWGSSPPWLLLGLLAVVIILQALMYGFLNLSSLVTLYAARLKRAYVGASNPAKGMGGYDVDQPGDLVPMYTYYGANPDAASTLGAKGLAHARPLHLINITVAQTEAVGESQVVAYDRKGLPLHVGPAGILSGVGRSNTTVQWRKYGECESLSLSEWTAISGAAASTAMGSIGSPGLSVLTMMTNVRLGYWWKQDQLTRWELPRSFRDTVPGYLFSEMTMNFDTSPKTKRRWYLTDGGHFENTGVYALLQRRLKFIIVSDNGADPDYHCDDMVRLIQRARIDLGAKIKFLECHDLDAQFGDECTVRKAFDSYDALATKPLRDKAKGGPYAALARIAYDDGSDGWLMLIKPRLSFMEPPELLAYHNRQAGKNFPQQTTLDQFFDEEQWEAYRRLGEVVGDALFAPVDAGALSKQPKWLPGEYLRYEMELP